MTIRKRSDIMFNEKAYKKILKFFLLIYPFFSIEFIYNSYFTLIQLATIFGLFIYCLIINKNSHKNIKYILIYYLILIIYGIFHHLNALNFTSLIPNNFNYNYLSEILQLFKLSTPVIFIYTLYYSNLNSKDYLDIIKTWIIIICGSIILTNIFKISLSSYGSIRIKYNIFEWFFHNYSYYETASKGFFMYPNQISSIISLIIPITIYYYFNNKISLIYLVMLLLSSLMLGTRVSNLGSIAIFIALILAFIFINLIKKHKLPIKNILKCIIISIIYLLILPISPAINRYKTYDFLETKEFIAYLDPEYLNSSKYQEDLEYIENNYKELLIKESFIKESYPYKYDPEFWLNILNKDINKRANYRYVEIAMVKRVIEINNNKLDILLGITNSRLQNIFNIERDFLVQYYAYGIIGLIIILGIYFIILFKNIINLFKKFNYFNTCLIASTLLLFLTSYLSGNILSQISCFIPLLTIISMNLKNNLN